MRCTCSTFLERAGDKFIRPCWKVQSSLLSTLSHPDPTRPASSDMDDFGCISGRTILSNKVTNNLKWDNKIFNIFEAILCHFQYRYLVPYWVPVTIPRGDLPHRCEAVPGQGHLKLPGVQLLWVHSWSHPIAGQGFSPEIKQRSILHQYISILGNRSILHQYISILGER